MFSSIKYTTKKYIHLLGKYTGTDSMYIAKNSFWTSFEFFISTILSTIIVIVLANLLPKETYGTYKYILTLGGSIGFLTLTGMNTAVTQAVAKGQNGIIHYALKIQLKWNLIYSFVAIVLASYYLINNNALIGYSMLVLAVSSPLTAAYNTYGAFLAGKKDFSTPAIYSLISGIIYFLSMMATLLITKSIIFLVIAYATSNVLPVIYFYYRTLDKYRPDINISSDERAQALSYARHMSAVGALSAIAQNIDKIAVFHYIGAIELATYSIASAIPERIRGFVKSIMSITFPKLSERTLININRSFYTRTFQAMAIGAVCALAYIIVSPFLYRLLLPQYLDAVAYSQVIATTLIFSTAAAYMSSVFRSQKMVSIIYKGSVSANILRLVLFVPMAKLWGVWGIIYSMLIMYSTGIIYNYYLWSQATKKITPLSASFDTHEDTRRE